MIAPNLRRTGALLVSAALLASLTVASVAAPASAAKPKCAGKTATIVGTNKGEVIKGTKKADVIVAKGGHDRIYGRGGDDTICGGPGHDRIVGAAGNDLLYGQTGRDKLFGGAGRDRLLGGPANDRLAGGPGNDACLQGSGIGLRVGCERPAPIVVPPPPMVVVPPPPIPEPKTLVVAYWDHDGTHTFDADDVLISKIVDTNGDGAVSPGDTIKMGQYPTTAFPATTSDFKGWGIKSHDITSVFTVNSNTVYLQSESLGWHRWNTTSTTTFDRYWEEFLGAVSEIADDHKFGEIDFVITELGSPSEPPTEVSEPADDDSWRDDDRLIDVEIYP